MHVFDWTRALSQNAMHAFKWTPALSLNAMHAFEWTLYFRWSRNTTRTENQLFVNATKHKPQNIAVLLCDIPPCYHRADVTTSHKYAVDLPPVSKFGPSRSAIKANSQGPSLTKRRSVVITCWGANDMIFTATCEPHRTLAVNVKDSSVVFVFFS